MNNNKGFTMIELLAVVAIMGILLGIAFQAYGSYIESSVRKSKEMFNESVIHAAEEYVLDTPEATEISIDDLIKYEYLEEVKDEKLTKGKPYKGKVDITRHINDGGLDTYDFVFYMCFYDDKYMYIEDPDYEIKRQKNPNKPLKLMIEKKLSDDSKCE